MISGYIKKGKPGFIQLRRYRLIHGIKDYKNLMQIQLSTLSKLSDVYFSFKVNE